MPLPIDVGPTHAGDFGRHAGAAVPGQRENQLPFEIRAGRDDPVDRFPRDEGNAFLVGLWTAVQVGKWVLRDQPATTGILHERLCPPQVDRRGRLRELPNQPRPVVVAVAGRDRLERAVLSEVLLQQPPRPLLVSGSGVLLPRASRKEFRQMIAESDFLRRFVRRPLPRWN